MLWQYLKSFYYSVLDDWALANYKKSNWLYVLGLLSFCSIFVVIWAMTGVKGSGAAIVFGWLFYVGLICGTSEEPLNWFSPVLIAILFSFGLLYFLGSSTGGAIAFFLLFLVTGRTTLKLVAEMQKNSRY